MEILTTAASLRERLRSEPSIVCVPTMGNLHEGHVALVELARQHAQCVVVSIFVNPLQFSPNEDLASYPRTFEQDRAKLDGLADVVFAPEVSEVYPERQTVFVEPPRMADELCGAFRPGHFRGVLTVVLKLFNMVQPNAAVFGKKDYQQLHVIRSMIRQLNLPIEIVAGETTRAPDGLALSSRNAYLSVAERAEATRLRQQLAHIRASVQAGNQDFIALEAAARADLEAHGWRVDYVSLRDAETLGEPIAGRPGVVLAAAYLGKTRLIDNLEVE
jgi:pantoate--beta-alanine ligase